MLSIHSANCKLNSKPLPPVKGEGKPVRRERGVRCSRLQGHLLEKAPSPGGAGLRGRSLWGHRAPCSHSGPDDKGVGAGRFGSGPLAFFPTRHEQGPACRHSPETAGARSGQCGHCPGATDQAGGQVGGMRRGPRESAQGTERSRTRARAPRAGHPSPSR